MQIGVSMENGAEAVALAFKVSHERFSKKPLVWLRIYSGEIRLGDELVCVSGGATVRK